MSSTACRSCSTSRGEFYDIDHLDRYYKHCVIGGAAAFIAPVFDLRHLSSTIRKKLVMEIASLDIEPNMAPIQYADAPGIVRAQLKLPTEKTDCTIGEKVWGGRGYYGGGGPSPLSRRPKPAPDGAAPCPRT